MLTKRGSPERAGPTLGTSSIGGQWPGQTMPIMGSQWPQSAVPTFDPCEGNAECQQEGYNAQDGGQWSSQRWCLGRRWNKLISAPFPAWPNPFWKTEDPKAFICLVTYGEETQGVGKNKLNGPGICYHCPTFRAQLESHCLLASAGTWRPGWGLRSFCFQGGDMAAGVRAAWELRKTAWALFYLPESPGTGYSVSSPVRWG